MYWTRDKSIMLSQVCVIVFMVLMAALDIGGYWAVRWFADLRGMHRQSETGMMATLYLCSIFIWIALWKMWKLLGNLKAEKIFTQENVGLMRGISWCCVCVACICLVSAVWYLPFVFVFIAAGFVALIVRIVKNVFQQAIAMKSELDLTI